MTLGAVFESLSVGALAEAVGRELAWPNESRAELLWPFWDECTECGVYSRLVAHPGDDARSSGKLQRDDDAWCVYCWESWLISKKNLPGRSVYVSFQPLADFSG